ncbi:MAG: Trk system potassium transporter TrkA [Clostridia bacterium]
MKIIIVGGGKVGLTLASQLSRENHEITLIDTNPVHVEYAQSSMDIQGVVGNGTSYRTQLAAGIEDADLMIAVTNSDETSLLSCLIAKKAGNCQTIARVRNPEYYQEIEFIKEELGLSMAINPEIAAAANIARLIQVPSALDVDSFAKGKINLLRIEIPENSCLDAAKISEVEQRLGLRLLICIVESGENVFIPNGDTVLHSGDTISVIIPLHEVRRALEKIGMNVKPIRSVMIAGGGNISYYLASALIRSKVKVKILELSKERCESLSVLLPEAMIINGDATDQQLLLEEGINDVDAFVSLTGIDEENILLSLYANKVSKAKLITKISKISFEEVVRELPIGAIIYPKRITSQLITSYVRSMQNSMGSNVETMYKMMDDRVEALEFKISEASKKDGLIDVPLMKLNLKPNLLVCSITRGKKIITPGGKDTFRVGDSVIVVTTNVGLKDLRDILA